MALGQWNVEALLRRMTSKQFRAWEMYYEVEPFGELRADYRAASIVQILFNVNRGKDQKPITLDECLLKFGEPLQEKKKQTPQQQFNLLKLLAAMHAGEPDPAPRVLQFPAPEQPAEPQPPLTPEAVEAELAKARAAMQPPNG